MSESKGAREPADRKPSLAFTIYPWKAHSIVTVDVGHHDSTGRHVRRIAYWHLELSRAELAGHSTDDVLRLICNGVLRRLESGAKDAGDQVAHGSDSDAAGPGAPDGATGRAVKQDCLPGTWPTPRTPGGIDSV